MGEDKRCKISFPSRYGIEQVKAKGTLFLMMDHEVPFRFIQEISLWHLGPGLSMNLCILASCSLTPSWNGPASAVKILWPEGVGR